MPSETGRNLDQQTGIAQTAGESSPEVGGESSVAGESPSPARRVSEFLRSHPEQIGPYRILDLVGEGGMGVVYRAEQRAPVHRTVAIKLIKPGMDSKEVSARFEVERRALALMDHPGVARVFDFGASEDRRSYFVMEYVGGEAITTYCDGNRLTLRRRLELFAQVCDAVQHAHTKGIIHRDIKASNVLVAPRDGAAAVPKVIDFGVAKAIEQRLTDRTLFTEQGRVIGTPEYMSPEQAEMNATDVDARTDIYSLGVLLYELLCGALPFEPKVLRAAAYGELQRIIREQDPPPPSARLMGLDEQNRTRAAEARRARVDQLVSELRGELEWVPLKAMRKDRTERYRTASELADDVRNYLNHRPLVAAPESRWYRARKTIVRNRVAFAAAAVVLISLVLTTVVTSVALVGQARARAEAERQKDGLAAVNEFLTGDLLGSADPARHRGNELTIREALDNAAATVAGRFSDQPLLEATVRHAIARMYGAVGRPDLGLKQAQGALDSRRRLLGNEHPETLESITSVANLLHALGRLPESEALEREALAAYRRLHGSDASLTLTSMNNLATVLQRQMKFDEAEALNRETIQRRRRVLGEDHPHTMASLQNLGSLLMLQHKYADAEPLLRESLARLRTMGGADDPACMIALGNLAYALRRQGKLGEAEPLRRECVELSRRVLGDDHPDTLIAIYNLADLFTAQGRQGDALPLFAELYDQSSRAPIPDKLRAGLVAGYGVCLADLARFSEAEQPLREAHAQFEAAGILHWPQTLPVLKALADVCDATGKPDEAERWRRALEQHPATTRSSSSGR